MNQDQLVTIALAIHHATKRKPIGLVIHPGDRESADRIVHTSRKGAVVRIIEDPTMTPGQCRVSQLERIEDA